MNRYLKLLFIFIFSACILSYSSLFNRPFSSGYGTEHEHFSNTASQKRNTVETNSQICQGENVKECVPPLMRFKQLYRTSTDHNLAACVIEKTFSTFLTAIMCFLHDPKTFRASNRTLDLDAYKDRLCKDKNEFTELRKIGNYQKMQLIAVVRNPLDRFVSGFTDKCLREKVWKKFKRRCAGCKSNLTCFVNKMYERMHRFARSPYRGIDFDDSHFFPQSWRCEFSAHLVKYHIFQLDSPNFYHDLLKMVEKQGAVADDVQFINKSLNFRTPHTTMDSVERAQVEQTVLNSPDLLHKIIQMYYFDFILFGYEIPRLVG